jgi:hypothetical protein
LYLYLYLYRLLHLHYLGDLDRHLYLLGDHHRLRGTGWE